MCRTLVEANAMIETCAKHGAILVMACHLNWYSYYTTTRRLIAEVAIGPLKTMVDAIGGVRRSIEAGRETTCPGEFGRETLEIAIAIRESHRRGNVRIDLPLEDRSLRMG